MFIEMAWGEGGVMIYVPGYDVTFNSHVRMYCTRTLSAQRRRCARIPYVSDEFRRSFSFLHLSRSLNVASGRVPNLWLLRETVYENFEAVE